MIQATLRPREFEQKLKREVVRGLTKFIKQTEPDKPIYGIFLYSRRGEAGELILDESVVNSVEGQKLRAEKDRLDVLVNQRFVFIKTASGNIRKSAAEQGRDKDENSSVFENERYQEDIYIIFDRESGGIFRNQSDRVDFKTKGIPGSEELSEIMQNSREVPPSERKPYIDFLYTLARIQEGYHSSPGAEEVTEDDTLANLSRPKLTDLQFER